MLKRKTLIPMAAIMVMSSGISSFANEADIANKGEFKEIKFKTGEVEPNKGLNVRKTNKIEKDNKIFAATKGTELDIVGQEDEWYKVELENDKFGWVNSNYIKLNNKLLYVNVDKLNFREEGDLDSKIIEVLKEGSKLELIEDNGNWLKVKYNNKEGYVYSKYITDEAVKIEVPSTQTSTRPVQNNNTQETAKPEQNNSTQETTKPEENNNTETTQPETTQPENTQKPEQPEQGEKPSVDNGNKQSAVVNLAYAQLGKPYVWGAEGPNSFDCSGLMTYIFKNGAGVNLPRTSSQQSNFGTTVSYNDLQPGDLIFSSTNGSGSVSHVGVYVGNGEMIHAPKPGDVVKKTNINNSYWQDAYLWAKRVL